MKVIKSMKKNIITTNVNNTKEYIITIILGDTRINICQRVMVIESKKITTITNKRWWRECWM